MQKRSILRYGFLLEQLVKRNFNTKYRQSVLGVLWSFLNPLLTMAVPTIFSQLITMVYNLADTFFIGMSNDPYKVAAAGLVGVLFFMLNSLANLFGVGGCWVRKGRGTPAV